MKREDCQRLLDNLPEYVDGEASADLCADIERHLSGCADCTVLVDTLRKTVSLVHSLPQPDLPDDARGRLYRSLDLADYLPPG